MDRRILGFILVLALTAIALVCAAMSPSEASDPTLDGAAEFVQAGSP